LIELFLALAPQVGTLGLRVNSFLLAPYEIFTKCTYLPQQAQLMSD